MRAHGAGAFVLGATLLLACRPAAPSGHDEGASSSTTASTEPSTSGTTAGGSDPVTEGESTTAGASSGDDGTTHATSTTAADGSTSGSETSGSETSGEPVSACQQGCAVEFMCTTDWPSEEGCVLACEANLVEAAAFSPVCADAWENVSECVGTLTCEDYLEWRMPTMFPYPCVDADEGLAFECKGQ